MNITPGPWRWEISMRSKMLQLTGGVPKFDLIVMDFVRWGMSGVAMRLREDKPGLNIMHRADKWAVPVVGREHHASWFQAIQHPDALVIQAAPDLLDALKALVEDDDTPKRNCTCHLAPPCADCVDHGHRRELISYAKAAIEKAEGRGNNAPV